MTADARFAVPVWRDTRKTLCWGIAGIKLIPLVADFAKEPIVQGVDPVFKKSRWYIPVAVFGEFNLPGNTALTRQDWREMCDGKTTGQIRSMMNHASSPYFGTRLLGVGILQAIGIFGAVAVFGWFFIRSRRMRKISLTVLSRSISYLAIGVMLFFIACLLSSAFRTKAFCEIAVRGEGNFRTIAAIKLSHDVWSDHVAATCLLKKIHHKAPQIRYNALALYDTQLYSSEVYRDIKSQVNVDKIHKALKRIAEEGRNPKMRALALSTLVDEFLRTGDMRWLVKKSRHPVDGTHALGLLRHFVNAEPAWNRLREAVFSNDVIAYRIAIGALKDSGRPASVSVFLEGVKHRNTSKVKETRLRRALWTMIKERSLPQQKETASVDKTPSVASGTSTVQDTDKTKKWDTALAQAARSKKIPAGLRIMAARRIQNSGKREQILTSLKNDCCELSKLMSHLSELSSQKRKRWLKVFRALGEECTDRDEDTIAEFRNNETKEASFDPTAWRLAKLVEKAETMASRNAQGVSFFGGVGSLDSSNTKAPEKTMKALCALLAASQEPQWKPLAILNDTQWHEIPQIVWLLSKHMQPHQKEDNTTSR
jgi:hypothetical protein